MASSEKKIQGRIAGTAILACLSLALAYITAKVSAYAYAASGNWSDTVLALSQNVLLPFQTTGVFEFAFDDMRVVSATLIAAAIPWLFLMMFGVRSQKLDNEDTGKEHGDDRLATKSEMQSSRDMKHLFNNIVYSKNCGIVFEAYNKKTRDAQNSRNFNTITFGISGLGKTFNLVKPNLMQACGNALPNMEYGWRNVPAHFKMTGLYRALATIGGIVKPVASFIGAAIATGAKTLGGIIASPVRTRMYKREEEKLEREFAASLEEEEAATDAAPAPAGEDSAEAVGEQPTEPLTESEEKDAREAIAEIEAEEEQLGTKADLETRKQGKLGSKEARRPWKRGKHAILPPDGPTASNVAREGYESMMRQRFALSNQVRAAIAQSAGSKGPKKRPEDALGGGFDVVNTDPKGDNVRDTGWMFLAAGFDVKVVNTVDFSEGLHMNPLAYIDTHLVDVKRAEKVTVNVSATAPETSERGAQDVTVTLEELTQDKSHAAQMPGTWGLDASISLSTETVSLASVPKSKLSVSELDDALAAADPSSEEFETLKAQRDMAWMEKDMGASIIRTTGEDGDEAWKLVPGSGCAKVASAVEAMKYRRTSGQVVVEIQNNNPNRIPATVTIDLDPCLSVSSIELVTAGQVEWPVDEAGDELAGGKITWKIAGVATHPDPEAPGSEQARVVEKLVLNVHIIPTKVPDGVWLTKTVDCLCANLRGTDAQANSSEDPFWEDTKRLCFMSLIAYLFERYDDAYHTLPKMMELLNMALDESGDPNVKSPLAVLMEQWEYARIYEATPPRPGYGGGSRSGGRWVATDNMPHNRDDSMALHCYHAFMSGAPETVQSIIISCQAALVNLINEDVKEMLAYDELHLETLGDPDQKQIIFVVTKDTDSPFDFLTALITFQAIDICQEKAYKRYGGKLPRHVRFELDEVANLGKIPILVRASAVVRSRNISISLYLQSKSQLAMVYGEKEAEIIEDNCSAVLFLGAQTKDTLEEMSVKVGVETVQARVFQRSAQDTSLIGSTSEQVTSNERRVMSSSQLSRMTKGWMMVYLFNTRAAYDEKFKTLEHPYYAYIDPDSKRLDWKMPLPVFTERFDYGKYRRGEYSAELEKIAKIRGK